MIFPLLLLALLYERDGSGDNLGLFPGSVVRFEADTGVTRCLPREREREGEKSEDHCVKNDNYFYYYKFMMSGSLCLVQSSGGSDRLKDFFAFSSIH